MKTKFKDKQNMIFRIALAAVLVFVIVSAVQVKNECDDVYRDIALLQADMNEKQRLYEELLNKNADDGTYLKQLLEQAAHDKGYYRPGELVFKEVPGI